jgi:hypothetical protein
MQSVRGFYSRAARGPGAFPTPARDLRPHSISCGILIARSVQTIGQRQRAGVVFGATSTGMIVVWLIEQ